MCKRWTRTKTEMKSMTNQMKFEAMKNYRPLNLWTFLYIRQICMYVWNERIVCCKRKRVHVCISWKCIFHLTWQMVNKPSLWNETLMVPKTPLRQIIYTQHFVASKFFFLDPNRPQLSAFRTCKLEYHSSRKSWTSLSIFNGLEHFVCTISRIVSNYGWHAWRAISSKS